MSAASISDHLKFLSPNQSEAIPPSSPQHSQERIHEIQQQALGRPFLRPQREGFFSDPDVLDGLPSQFPAKMLAFRRNALKKFTPIKRIELQSPSATSPVPLSLSLSPGEFDPLRQGEVSIQEKVPPLHVQSPVGAFLPRKGLVRSLSEGGKRAYRKSELYIPVSARSPSTASSNGAIPRGEPLEWTTQRLWDFPAVTSPSPDDITSPYSSIGNSYRKLVSPQGEESQDKPLGNPLKDGVNSINPSSSPSGSSFIRSNVLIPSEVDSVAQSVPIKDRDHNFPALRRLHYSLTIENLQCPNQLNEYADQFNQFLRRTGRGGLANIPTSARSEGASSAEE